MSLTAPEMDDVTARELADRIAAWLRERLDDAYAERFIFGLSGGLDSAVVCGLCAQAVGPERVLAVIMPSASIAQDEIEAMKVADTFGVKVMTVDLTGVANALFDAIPAPEHIFGKTLGEPQPANLDARLQLARANVRPRSRMIVNYYLSNLSGGLVVGTSNKTEYLIGYSTKYGDAGVDIAPLLDLYKFEVRAVARAIGVPESVISRPPSAGLWKGQTDEDEIGLTYAELDRTLIAIETGETDGISEELLTTVWGKVQRSAHKRTPMPTFQR